MANRPRIGILEPSSKAGGVSRYVQAILDGTDPREFNVVLFGSRDHPYRLPSGVGFQCLGSSSGRSQTGDVEGTPERRKLVTGRRRAEAFRCLAPQWMRYAAGMAKDAAAIARPLWKYPVDLLHVQFGGLVDECPLGAWWADVPRVVGTLHVDHTYELNGRTDWCKRLFETFAAHAPHRLIAVSDATKRNWIARTRVAAWKVDVIHNGVDPAAFQRRRFRDDARRALGLQGLEGSIVIGGVGRLSEQKGFSYLLDAMARLESREAAIVLVIAGDGPLSSELRQRCDHLGISGRVRFLGFCPDVRTIYDAIDVFAMPSLCEALPYALLEAMATGLPIVGATVGGIPEVIVDGKTGMLVPPRNAGALVAALRQLVESEALRSKMGAAARERVESCFTEADMVAKTLAVYRSVLDRRTSRRMDRAA